MKHTFEKPSGLAALAFLAFTSTIQAHTWVEQLTLVASNGTFVGTPGYPRGLVPRLPGVDPDEGMVYLLPPNGRSTGNEILQSDLMCKSSQTIGTQTAGYPPLTAAPGDQIAMIYQENGHVTQLSLSPGPRPVGSGTVYIYGTKQPANTDTYLGIHRVWNTAGTGGDKRGKLLATRPFDDGQCFQNTSSPIVPLQLERRKEFNPVANDLKCQTDVQVPTEAGTSGTYTFYWVWEWPQLSATTGAVAKNESYTTCMDINMSANKLTSAGSFDTSQIVDSRAIEAQLSSAFLVNPTIAEQLTGAPGAKATAAPSASVSASNASAQTSAANSATNAPAGGFITVTVTANAAEKTVTVTKTLNGGASEATPTSPAGSTHSSPKAQTSTVIISPLPSTSETSAASSPSTQHSAPASQATASGSAPPIVPFLSPASQIAKAPAQASTLVTSQAKPSLTLTSSAEESASAAATSDCPDMTPGASSSATATYSRKLAPKQSATSYLNESLHNPPPKLRGRFIRS